VEGLENIGLPELTPEQIEELCSIAEETARAYIFSKVPPKKVETLNVSADVELENGKPLTLTVEVDLTLSPLMQNFDAQKLANEAVKEAFVSAEKYLRELKCRLQK
jgi:virulence-associated protein VagC